MGRPDIPLTLAVDARDLLASIVTSSDDAIITKDLNGIITSWNQAAERMFGYPATEAIGKSIRMIIPADRQLEEDEVLAKVRAGHSVVHFETMRQRKDGTPVPISLTVSPVRDHAGTIVGASKVARDLTPQRATLHLGAIVESSDDAIVGKDLNGIVRSWNGAAERMFGFTAEEMIGRSIRMVIPADRQTEEDTVLARLRRGEKIDHFETVRQKKDGTQFPISLSVSPIRDGTGAIVGASKIARDLSPLRAYATALEQERRLHDKNLELEKASLAKDRFLASMSHELRTPLNAIIGFTGTLLMRLPGPLTADQDHQLQTVRTSARHLLSLINDLLDLAKIQSGKVEVVPESVACQSVVNEVVTTLRPLAEAKGLRFEVSMPAQDVMMHTDRRALSQILINLTNNAIKFTESGLVRLEVARPRADDRAIELRVIDTGRGIPPDDQEKLFNAFTQLGASHAGGTGLGLHLSQKLAELLEGSIRFTSESGKGSTFILSLPRS